MSEKTYRLMGQVGIYFFCLSCERGIGKIFQALVRVQTKQNEMEDRIQKHMTRLGTEY